MATKSCKIQFFLWTVIEIPAAGGLPADVRFAFQPDTGGFSGLPVGGANAGIIVTVTGGTDAAPGGVNLRAETDVNGVVTFELDPDATNAYRLTWVRGSLRSCSMTLNVSGLDWSPKHVFLQNNTNIPSVIVPLEYTFSVKHEDTTAIEGAEITVTPVLSSGAATTGLTAANGTLVLAANYGGATGTANVLVRVPRGGSLVPVMTFTISAQNPDRGVPILILNDLDPLNLAGLENGDYQTKAELAVNDPGDYLDYVDGWY